jgi:hypothetical protein
VGSDPSLFIGLYKVSQVALIDLLHYQYQVLHAANLFGHCYTD